MSDSVQKQISDEIDSLLLNDIQLESEESLARRNLNNVTNDRIKVGKEVDRLRIALFALTGKSMSNGSTLSIDARDANDKRKRVLAKCTCEPVRHPLNGHTQYCPVWKDEES